MNIIYLNTKLLSRLAVVMILILAVACKKDESYGPFDNTSFVNVELKEASELLLKVYNLMGQVVYEYSAGHVFAGSHQLTIDAGNLTEGVYFYTVKAGENSITRKMIVE